MNIADEIGITVLNDPRFAVLAYEGYEVLVEYRRDKFDENKVELMLWLRKKGYGIMNLMFGVSEVINIEDQDEIISVVGHLLRSNIEEYVDDYEEDYGD